MFSVYYKWKQKENSCNIVQNFLFKWKEKQKQKNNPKHTQKQNN